MWKGTDPSTSFRETQKHPIVSGLDIFLQGGVVRDKKRQDTPGAWALRALNSAAVLINRRGAFSTQAGGPDLSILASTRLPPAVSLLIMAFCILVAAPIMISIFHSPGTCQSKVMVLYRTDISD